jgi:hypothetical protein
MDKNGLETGQVVIKHHPFKVTPIGRGQLPERLAVGRFEGAFFAKETGAKEAPFVVPEEADGIDRPGEGNDAAAVRSVVDEVAEENDAIVIAKPESVKQVLEFQMAPMHVSNGDQSFDHRQGEAIWRPGRSLRPEPLAFPFDLPAFSLKFSVMVWQIRPFSHRCFVTATPFRNGDTYISYLVIDPRNELQRYDVAVAQDETFHPEGDLLCRWKQVYKKEPEKDDSSRRQKETAEGLFISLYDDLLNHAADEEATEGPVDPDEEREIMKKFLALLLERKKVLRARGETPDGRFRLMEHVRSKTIYPVAAGDIGQDEFMKISGRLSELVGK